MGGLAPPPPPALRKVGMKSSFPLFFPRRAKMPAHLHQSYRRQDALSEHLCKMPFGHFRTSSPKIQTSVLVLFLGGKFASIWGLFIQKQRGKYQEPLILLRLCLTKVGKYANLVGKITNLKKGGISCFWKKSFLYPKKENV